MLSLGFLIFLLPLLSYEELPSLALLISPMAVLTFLTNIHQVRVEQVHLSMICLAGLFGYFAVSALGQASNDIRVLLYEFAKFTGLALVLSLVVRHRRQMLVVLCAMAVSAIYVALASRGALTETQEAVNQALMSNRPAYLARTAGVFRNENDLAMFALDAIVAAVILYLSIGKTIALALAAPCIAAAVRLALFSGSRKALLGIGLVAVFAVWFLFRSRKRAVFSVIFVVLAMAIGGAVWILKNPYLSRFNTQEASFEERRVLLTESLEVWQHNPVLGLGYHGLERVSHSGAASHCTPLEMLANGGIVAFGLYAFLWWGLFRTAARCLAGERYQNQLVLLYGVAFMLLLQAINSLTFVSFEHPRWLALTGCICGFLRAKELELRELVTPTRRPWPQRGFTNGSARIGRKQLR